MLTAYGTPKEKQTLINYNECRKGLLTTPYS